MKRWLLLSAAVLAPACSSGTDPDLEPIQLFLRGTIRSSVDSTRIAGATIEVWGPDFFGRVLNLSRTADSQGNFEVTVPTIRYNCSGHLFRAKASGFSSRDIRGDGGGLPEALAFVCQNGIQQIDIYLQPGA
jgi:hypothetical protein